MCEVFLAGEGCSHRKLTVARCVCFDVDLQHAFLAGLDLGLTGQDVTGLQFFAAEDVRKIPNRLDGAGPQQRPTGHARADLAAMGKGEAGIQRGLENALFLGNRDFFTEGFDANSSQFRFLSLEQAKHT